MAAVAIYTVNLPKIWSRKNRPSDESPLFHESEGQGERERFDRSLSASLSPLPGLAVTN